MSQLTDAIKARNTEKALDLIYGRNIYSRMYRRVFNTLYGNLLTAPEITEQFNMGFIKGTGDHKFDRVKRSGYDPLQLAAKEGLIEIVRALLGAGISVQRTPPNDYSNLDFYAIKHLTPPLNLALEFGHDTTAMALIEFGADVNAYSYTDRKCFGVPYNELLNNIVNLDVATPLYFAVTGRCNLATMRALVGRGAVVSDSFKTTIGAFCKIEDGFYPWLESNIRGSILLNAIAHFDDTRIDVIEFLLEHGAELDKYIHYKYERGHALLANELEQQGFNQLGFNLAEHQAKYGNGVYDSALTLALRGGKIAIAKLLLQNGARIFDINTPNLQASYDKDRRKWEQILPSNIIVMAQQMASEIYPHDIIEKTKRFATKRTKLKFIDNLGLPYGVEVELEFFAFIQQYPVLWIDDIWVIIRDEHVMDEHVMDEHVMDQQVPNEMQPVDPVENPIIPIAEQVGITWLNQIINFFGWRDHVLPNAEPPRQPPAQEQNVAAQVPALMVRAFRLLPQTNIPIIQQEFDKLVQIDPTMSNHNFDETLICPINRTLMIEPVMVIETGNTYESSAILQWFETHSTDPLSGRQLSNKAITSNGAVKRIILAELQRLYTAAEARKNLAEEDVAAPQEVQDPIINQLDATGESRVGLLDNTDLGVNDSAPAMNTQVRRFSI